MEAGGVEDGNRRVVGTDQEADLGAAQQDALRTPIGKLAHDPPILVARGRLDPADTELVVDDVVDDATIGVAGYEHLEPVDLPKAAGVEVLLHGVGGREQSHGSEAL